MVTVVTVEGKYIPTTTILQYSTEVDVFYVEMHGTYWVFSGRFPEKLQAGMRVCFRFATSGNTAWAYDGNGGEWLGPFQPPHEEGA